jgi:quinoprotein glucose dehydrogenase
MYRRLLALLVLTVPATLAVLAGDLPKPYNPRVLPASDEPARAVKNIRVPQGMKIDLWAAEPMLANPVVFSIDHKGRVYVAETFRLHAGVTDIRSWLRAGWLDDDLACRTVDDRLALMKRHLGKRFADYGVHHERIRLLEDTKGTGKADRATVFADGFNRPQDGIAAGVLARGKDVYYACIPDLWLLRDNKGTGKADERRTLSSGYGVHIGYIGHDLHGLVLGPDGKLYFSIGDRGLNVKTKDRHLFYPDTGCVLRCNTDGSDLEVFATGLRNPQELAFDQYGNLFTGDNNSDGGDRARWVYIVEDGDSGWRIGYQFGGVQSNRGPWNAEKLWHPQHPSQAAWIVPPVANVADGPAGLTYYPGVGLPPRYNEHFFLADFRGASPPSGIRSFAVKPKGAGFDFVDSHEFVWGLLPTDVDFGMDGSVYISDWVHGWGMPGKGRLWKVSDPKCSADPVVGEVKKLMAEGYAHRRPADLGKLLAHPDMRVRLEAQRALVEKGPADVTELTHAAKTSRALLARLHGIWGLGQVGRKTPAVLDALVPLLADGDAEVRAQAAKVLGDGKVAAAGDRLVELLGDAEPRVAFFAAQALGKMGHGKAVAALVRMIGRNNDRDPYLRHAGVVALARLGSSKELAELERDASLAVRRAVLLAYRRQGSVRVGQFLDDVDADLVVEAARAINDVPIDAAMPRLAGLIERKGASEPLGYRVLNANFRLGKAENARAVARFAARSGEHEALRVEALRELERWSSPPGRDRVMGVWRPLPARPAGLAADALRASLGGIFTGPGNVRKEAARVAAKLGIKEIGPALFALAGDTKQPALVRVETLRALAALKDSRLDQAVKLALDDAEPRLRAEGRRVLAALRPAEALAALESALDRGTLVEKQQAFDVLGSMKGDRAQELLGGWLDRLLAGKVPAEVRLDLVEAAEKHPAAALKKKLARYEATRPKGEPFGPWRDSLVGGDAEAGRHLFLFKSEVSCLRCHKAGSDGTGEVGPDLTGIGSKQKRDYLLESIVYPSKQIAKGYETVELVLTTGQVRSGILKSEDEREVRLMTAEGTLIRVAKSKIDQRRSGKSAMPEDLTKHLSRKEMRDLVEFLAGLKEAVKK